MANLNEPRKLKMVVRRKVAGAGKTSANMYFNNPITSGFDETSPLHQLHPTKPGRHRINYACWTLVSRWWDSA
jgi:hypothetical protein